MKKILARISFITLAVCTIAYGILMIIFPTEVKHYTTIVWDILNRPLPVIGVSSVIVMFFVLKVFSLTSLGKKQINEFKLGEKRIEVDFEETKKYLNAKLDNYRREIIELNEYIRELKETYDSAYKELCSTIPNKKVNALGVKLYGEKTIDNETEAE